MRVILASDRREAGCLPLSRAAGQVFCAGSVFKHVDFWLVCEFDTALVIAGLSI